MKQHLKPLFIAFPVLAGIKAVHILLCGNSCVRHGISFLRALLGQMDWYLVLIHLLPLVSFVVGLYLFPFLSDPSQTSTASSWQSISILSSTLILSSIIFDNQFTNLALNSVLLLSCGIQHQGIRQTKHVTYSEQILSVLIIALFLFGVAVGTLLIGYRGSYTVWSASILGFSFFSMLYAFSLDTVPISGS